MTDSKIPPQLILPERFAKSGFQRIRNGCRGIVFRLSSEYAGKILYRGDCRENVYNFEVRDDQEAIDLLVYEHDIALRLFNARKYHDADILVPEPIGVEMIRFDDKIYPTFVMQYLPYPSGAELGFYEHEISLRQAKNHIGEAMLFDFEPGKDCTNPNNFMYNRKNKRTYLIDFEFWKYGWKTELLNEYSEEDK